MLLQDRAPQFLVHDQYATGPKLDVCSGKLHKGTPLVIPGEDFVYDENVKRAIRSGGMCSGFLLLLATFSTAQKTARQTATSLPDCGPLLGQVLHCARLGFTYRVPFGWVDRTVDMQEKPVAEGTPSGQTKEETGKTLLAIFERPPGAPGDDVNSTVIIAIEDRSVYPQVESAADYFGPLSEVAEQRGLKMDGNPYSFSVGSQQLVRGDFAGATDKAPLKQASLVLLQRGYILSFTFLSSSNDEVDGLIENLTFRPAPQQSHQDKGDR